jgi:tripartite-type tricarboxylate transporter receptor subunit TctC
MRLTHIFCMLAIAGLAALPSHQARAQNYPNRAVRVIVPFAPGGAVDTVTRLVSAKMSDQTGQPVIVENRTGAGGNLGTDAVAKSAPDGYTILKSTNGHAISATLYRSLPFDPVKDFIPVTQVLASTLVLVSSPKFPATTAQEAIALAKANPGGLNYGSSGLGAPLHLAMEMFKHSVGIDVVHVPYRGDALLYAALITGDIQLAIVPQSTGLPQIKSGAIRALAVTGLKRSPVLPDVPTFTETGASGLESPAWTGMFVPAGTPQETVVTIQKEVAKALAAPDVRERILGMGQEPVGSTPKEFDALFKSDIAKFAQIIADAKIPKLD